MENKILGIFFIATIFLAQVALVNAEETIYCEDNPHVNCICKEGIRQLANCPIWETCTADITYQCLIGDYAKGEVIVGFNYDIDLNDAKELISNKGLSIKKDPIKWEANINSDYPYILKWIVIIVPVGDEQKWLMEFEKEGIVDYAELNWISSTSVGGSVSETTYCEDNPYDMNCICKEGEKQQITCPEGETCTAEVKFECIKDNETPNLIYWIIGGVIAIILIILFFVLRKKK